MNLKLIGLLHSTLLLTQLRACSTDSSTSSHQVTAKAAAEAAVAAAEAAVAAAEAAVPAAAEAAVAAAEAAVTAVATGVYCSCTCCRH